mmetsp:Transcript_5424/g.16138  ORF Transcript_5424/g.16138 Transcript_5424/m.16138 type:complete len:283 (-) Transcript_5424:946-1794(-)
MSPNFHVPKTGRLLKEGGAPTGLNTFVYAPVLFSSYSYARRPEPHRQDRLISQNVCAFPDLKARNVGCNISELQPITLSKGCPSLNIDIPPWSATRVAVGQSHSHSPGNPVVSADSASARPALAAHWGVRKAKGSPEEVRLARYFGRFRSPGSDLHANGMCAARPTRSNDKSSSKPRQGFIAPRDAISSSIPVRLRLPRPHHRARLPLAICNSGAHLAHGHRRRIRLVCEAVLYLNVTVTQPKCLCGISESHRNGLLESNSDQDVRALNHMMRTNRSECEKS